MDNLLSSTDNSGKPKFGTAIQVRLVSNFKKSQHYYRDVLGCRIDDWGHAERDGMTVILQQALSQEDVRPNAVSKKRNDYPTDWKGPDAGWDTFIHVKWEEIDPIIEDIRNNGGIIRTESMNGNHGGWQFRNAIIQDPDGYQIVLGAMREIGDRQ